MIESADQALIDVAGRLIRERFKPDRHHLAAALRTASDAVFAGVHVEAYVGRIALCAEAVAIGAAATAGDMDVATIVAVDRQGHVVSPCGMCRELLLDYAPAAHVIILREGQPVAVPVRELLPDKCTRDA